MLLPKKTEAIITDSITKESRRFMTEPLTNYNILVLDQQFNKNSSVTVINTNVTRNGHFRDANVFVGSKIWYDASNSKLLKLFLL